MKNCDIMSDIHIKLYNVQSVILGVMVDPLVLIGLEILQKCHSSVSFAHLSALSIHSDHVTALVTPTGHPVF